METYIYNLLSWCFALAIWILVLKLYRDFTVSLFRQDLFILRDRMFDDAKNGALSFDAPAYQLLRITMNGFIRYGHKLTAYELYVVSREKGDDDVSYIQAWMKATAGLDGATLELLETYRDQMNTLAIRQVIIGSPELLLTMVVPVVALTVFVVARASFKSALLRLPSLPIMKSPFNNMDAMAASYGQ